jgi:hypothetical protein
MAATTESWMTASKLPRGSSYQEMLKFFGIPPYSADRLDENISRKRRSWHHKGNCGNPVGRAKAKEVVALINNLALAVKRGVADDTGGGAETEIPEAVFRTLEELWKIISELVLADEYDAALHVAREAVSRWGLTPDAGSVLAWVVSTGFNTGNLIHPGLLAEGMQAADVAVRGQAAEVRNWESKISLLVASSRMLEALASAGEAERALAGRMTARLHILGARALMSLNRAEEAMVAAIRAVNTALPDPDNASAIRAEATELLVRWVAANLLPIKSPATLSRYVEMVNAAAWCSHGVPEAEDMVRVHRMWAVNAGKRVFVGSWKLRSFLAVCTGFISLPIHNYLRSSPAWHVFIEGLEQNRRGLSFTIVASPQYVQRAHNMNLAGLIDDF